jgi:hypothetical protein
VKRGDNKSAPSDEGRHARPPHASNDRNTSCEKWAEVIDLVKLPVGARPIPYAGLEYEEVPASRHLDCDTYGACLDFVASIRWVGFSCRRCPFNAPEANEVADGDLPAQAGAVIPLL